MNNYENKDIGYDEIDEEIEKEEPKKTLVQKAKERFAEEEGLPFYVGGIAVGMIAGGAFMRHKIMNHKVPFVNYDRGKDYNIKTKDLLRWCKKTHKEGREIWGLNKRDSDLIKKSDDPNWEIILKLKNTGD